MKEWILHIDGDAFFASCEVSRRPDLFGRPVVVGEERGIATALTYPAKALGVKRGDPIFKIKKEHPEVVILSSHFELYRKFAKNLKNLLLDEVEKFEAYSIDECFATIKGEESQVTEKVKNLKTIIQKKLGITYSFGVSTTKTLAKVASKKNKPNGITFLMNQESINQALKETEVESIWGVGWATAKKLKRNNIVTAYEFINSDLRKALKSAFNKPLFQTVDELCGHKHFEVGQSNPHKKSIQSTRSFLQKTSDKNILCGELSRNIEIACSEARKDGLLTNRVYFFVKPKDQGERYLEKAFELPNFTNLDTNISKYIERLFDECGYTGETIYKKTGVILLNLISGEDLKEDLFNQNMEIKNNESKVTGLLDGLRHKYGFAAISWASSLSVNNNRKEDYRRRHRKDIYESGLPFPFIGIIT